MAVPRKYNRTCPVDDDTIGKLAEGHAYTALIENGIFDVECLGGKVPAFDLLCTIKDKNNPYMFLVQVKGIYKGAFTKTTTPIRIKTPVPKEKLGWLVDRPLPTYVAGVACDTKNVYIAPAFKTSILYPSIPITNVLSAANPAGTLNLLKKIKDDVIAFWTSVDIKNKKNVYHSLL